MRIGYHHHVPVGRVQGVARFPAHYGIFVNELARQAGSVTFFAFETQASPLEDLELDRHRVEVVSLGRRPRFPKATYGSPGVWRRVADRLEDLDVLLVRGPGPLIPRLLRLGNSTPAVALMVGSWRSWAPSEANSRLENFLISWYVRAYEVDQNRAVRDRLVLTNNAWLRHRFLAAGCRDVREVFTSSLSAEMLRGLAAQGARRLQSHEGAIRLLYTGRIVEEKGVLDLVESVALLRRGGVNVELDLVGWTPEGDPTPQLVSERSSILGVSDAVRIGPYREAGPELTSVYRNADVYVFAGRAEWGMPHAVIEGMAAGLPVILTAIEGVRGLLEHRRHAWIVVPGAPKALADGVQKVITDESLRARLCSEGRRWALERSNEVSVSSIIAHLASLAHSR